MVDVCLFCQLASLRADSHRCSAVRHHDSQPNSKTARTPPAHTFTFKPLRDVAGAENIAAQRANGWVRLLEPGPNIVVVGQVVVWSSEPRYTNDSGKLTVPP